MTLLEFFLINAFYLIPIALYIRKVYTPNSLAKLAATVLISVADSPVGAIVAKWIQAQNSKQPVVSKEGSLFHIRFLQNQEVFDIYLPYNRALRKPKKYSCFKNETLVRSFTSPQGLVVAYDASMFKCDAIVVEE
jgi:hypothetical protein